MSIKQKTLIPVILALVVTAGLLTGLSVLAQNRQVEEQEQQRLEYMGNILTEKIKSRGDMSVALAASIAGNPEVQKAFADRDRQGLLNMLLTTYQGLAKSSKVSQGQFHLAPATSFLRLHQPDKFGDDLSSFRATVLAANKEKRPISGLEKGKGGYGIRGVVPVFYLGEHVGSFEIGMDFDKAFLQEIKDSYGADVAVYLNESNTKVQSFQEEGTRTGGESAFTLYAATLEKPLTVEKGERLQVFDSGQSQLTRLTQGDSSFAVLSIPIRDYTDAVVGLAEISVKRDAALAQVASSRNNSLAVGAAILLAMLLLVWVTITRVIVKPLRSMAGSAAAIAAGDVDQQVQVGGSDEIGQLASTFRHMVTYLQSMVGVAHRLAEGDLTVQVAPQSESDQLGNAFAGMVAKLRELVGQVQTSALSLADTSNQLGSAASETGAAVQQVTSTIQQVAQGAQQQSVSAQATSESVDQLNQTIARVAGGAQEQARTAEEASTRAAEMAAGVEQVAAQASRVAETSQKSREAAINGSRMVQEAITGIGRLKETVNHTAAQIDSLGQASEQIGAVVDTIDDIAEQTNLLALNAAIEAARAGEHGRGFAVVADEVRKLAERSSGETRQIAQLVRDVQAGVRSAVDAMHTGTQEAEAGTGLAVRAGEALDQIVQATEQTVEQVSSIAGAAKEMARSSSYVAGALGRINGLVREAEKAAEQMESLAQQVARAVEAAAATAEENSAATEEVSASAEEMSAQVEEMSAQAQELSATADKLRELVARFRLEASTAGQGATTGIRPNLTPRRRASDWTPEGRDSHRIPAR